MPNITKNLLLSGALLLTFQANADPIIFQPGNPAPPTQLSIGTAPVVMQYSLVNTTNANFEYRLIILQNSQINLAPIGTTCVYNISPAISNLGTLPPKGSCTINFSIMPGMQPQQYPSTQIAYARDDTGLAYGLFFSTSIIPITPAGR